MNTTDLIIEKLQIALHDAIRRPMGVVPVTAEDFVTADGLIAAEKRRVSEEHTISQPQETIDIF